VRTRRSRAHRARTPQRAPAPQHRRRARPRRVWVRAGSASRRGRRGSRAGSRGRGSANRWTSLTHVACERQARMSSEIAALQSITLPAPPRLDHGVIGNGRVLALVSPTSAIEWLCLPRFDSPSIFASILDREHGGTFRILSRGREVAGRMAYVTNTNVLRTS